MRFRRYREFYQIVNELMEGNEKGAKPYLK
jgi:hypothetical protein